MNGPSPADETLRLFPLPDVVLLPLGLLPLHIFEPRYRQMTEDALASDRLITMVLPNGPVSQEQVPIHPIGCVGKVHHEKRLPDGRFKLVLIGEFRVRIEKEIQSDKLYRQASFLKLEDEFSPNLHTRRQLQRSEVLALLRKLLPRDNEIIAEFFKFLTGDCKAGVFADVVTYAAPLEIRVKQKLLESTNVDHRLEILVEALRETKTKESSQWQPSFPPDFAAN